jgi:hypothetical protein
MSNLLPREVKHALEREYRARLYVMWCAGLSGACLCATLLFLPSYVSTSMGLSSARATVKSYSSQSQEAYSAIRTDIEFANALSARLTRTDTTVTVTQVLSAIENEHSAEISISGIEYERIPKKVPIITVSGTARTRDALAQFVERLKLNPYFTDAKVPLTQLAQANNATFTIALVVRPPRTDGDAVKK